MTKTQLIIAFGSALIGSIVGGLIAIYAAIKAVDRTEYYRLRPRIKRTLKYTISKVGQHNFPWVLVQDDTTDDLVSDILRVMPCTKRPGFEQKWKEYRYDKTIPGTVPSEYEQSTDIGRKLITERLHNLISKI